MLGAVVGGYLVLAKYAELMQRIWPSAAFAPSTSKAPYELRFRNSVRNELAGAKTGEVGEWVLAPPRAFLLDAVGTNGATRSRVSSSTMKSNSYYAVYLEAILLEDGTIVPKTTVPKDQQRRRSLLFHINNAGANSGFKLAGGCVPQERANAALRLVGPTDSGDGFPCTDRDFRCEIVMPMDGWNVEVSATHDLYGQPDRVCAIARQFLDRYTVKRDNIELP